jgi:hypothetical protein
MADKKEKKKRKPATKRKSVKKKEVNKPAIAETAPTPKPDKPKVEPICATCKSWKQHAPKFGTCFNGDSKYYNKDRVFDAVCDLHG